MLDFLRKSATSVFAWLLLIVLALGFGLTFGLPSGSDMLSFGKTKYVSVYGESIGDDDFRYELMAIRRIGGVPQDERVQEQMGLKEEVLEASIEREMLAELAEEMGLAATVRDAEDLTISGQSIVLGATFEWLDGLEFNYDIFTKSFLPPMQVSEKQYLEYQRKELLARTLRDLVGSSVALSDGELRQIYEDGANRISLRYARYEPVAFGDLVDPSPGQVDDYIAKNGDALKAELGKQGARFSKLPKQARVWVISIDKGDASGDAKGKVAGARTRLAKGEDFRAVARELSTHDTARRGGDFGWISEAAGTGIDPAIDAALPELAIDDVSKPIEGETAVWLVLVTGRREGDVAEADALRELAEEAIKREQGRTLAKTAAEEDLAQLSSGAALTDVFQGGAALPGGEDIENAGTKRDPTKVELADTGSFSKGEPIPGLGPVRAIVDAVWAAEPDQSMLPQTFDVGDDIVLVGVQSKEAATDAGFAEARPELYKQLLRAKGAMVNAAFAHRQCLEAKGRGDISPSEDKIAKLVTYATAEAKDGEKPPKKPYAVCDRIGASASRQ